MPMNEREKRNNRRRQLAVQRTYRRLAKLHAEEYAAIYREEMAAIGGSPNGGNERRQCRNAECRVWFVPRTGKQVYCCRKCSVEVFDRKRRASKLTKKCGSCGEFFVTAYGQAKYCSKRKCKEEGRRINQRARRAREGDKS